MSNVKNFGKCFGPSTRHLSFRLRCPIFLLSKFVSQLKLIQSVVRVGILGICVTSSILKVLLSGFWTSGSQIPSPRDPVPGSWVSGSQFQGPGCQGLVSQGPRAPGPRFPGPGSQRPRVSSLSVLGSQAPRVSGSRASGPDFRVYLLKSVSNVLNSKSGRLHL